MGTQVPRMATITIKRRNQTAHGLNRSGLSKLTSSSINIVFVRILKLPDQPPLPYGILGPPSGDEDNCTTYHRS